MWDLLQDIYCWLNIQKLLDHDYLKRSEKALGEIKDNHLKHSQTRSMYRCPQSEKSIEESSIGDILEGKRLNIFSPNWEQRKVFTVTILQEVYSNEIRE